jgi:microcin C transport system ATP-binding protein
MNETPLISVEDLSVDFRSGERVTHAVKHVSFDIGHAETVALVGESGSGKTVTALSILKLLPYPSASHPSGKILFNGANLLSLPQASLRKIRGNKISMIFQEPMTSLNPLHTIENQVGEVLKIHRGLSDRAARERVLDLLRKVGIDDPEGRLKSYPHQLSGGQRQRVMIAMALANEPDLLIADEPTTALDVTIQAQILDLIRAEQERRQLAVLLITHNLAVVSQVADRVAVMYAGEIVEEAPASEIFGNPRHPYTQGLLSSIPSAAGQSRHLYTIPGRVPDPRALPPACLFAPRCPYVIRRCWHEHPELEASDGHLLRCWNPQPFTALRAVEPEVDRSVATSE